MGGLLVLGFPFLLLGFMLFMGRVEEPLSRAATERKIEHFLDHADPGEIDTFVHRGTESALRRFTARLRGRRVRADSNAQPGADLEAEPSVDLVAESSADSNAEPSAAPIADLDAQFSADRSVAAPASRPLDRDTRH